MLERKELSLEKIGKEWQHLGYENGWTKDCIENRIYHEVCNRGGKFKDEGTIRGDHTCTCEEFMVSFKYDSSD
jgi:hypothetical protein